MHGDSGAPIAGGEQGCFIEDVGQDRLRSSRECCGRCAIRSTEASILIFARMHFQDLEAAFDIGQADDDAPVEAAGPQEGFVENVGAVGRRHQDDPFFGIKAIHLDEQLVERLLPLIMAAANACAAVAADSIDLIHEDDARGLLFGLVEQIADAAGADADKHLDEVGTGDGEEGAVRFAGHRFGDQRFPCPWRADAENPFGNAPAQGGKFLRVFQKLDDLLQALLWPHRRLRHL